MTTSSTQLIFDLPVRHAFEREDFFVSPSNQQAVAALDNWQHWPNPVMVLSGEAGSGKTHLARVWQRATRAKLTTPEQLAFDALPDMLTTGALIVEDCPGSKFDDQVVFHLINLAKEHGARLLLTSQRPAAAWGVVLADLKSRLNAAGSAQILAPDDALLRAILIKQFSDRQLQVDETVISYMLSRMERSAQAARALVGEIDKKALRQKANITRPFVSGIMNQQLDFPDFP